MCPWVTIKGKWQCSRTSSNSSNVPLNGFTGIKGFKRCLMIVLCSDIVARIGAWSPLYQIGGSIVGHLLPRPRC